MIVLSAALTALCVVPYLRDIARGTTRPQRASWCIFASLSIVAAAAQFIDGGGPGAWLALGSAIGFSAVFIASIRHGEGGSSVMDRCSLAVAAVGVVVSVLASEPLIAVIAVIVAELCAVSLTARKAANDPRSETLATWCIDALAGALAIAAATTLSARELLYPIHHVVVNLWVAAAIIHGSRRQVSSAPS